MSTWLRGRLAPLSLPDQAQPYGDQFLPYERERSEKIYSVFINAMSACLSPVERPSPKAWPFTARVLVPKPLKPDGT